MSSRHAPSSSVPPGARRNPVRGPLAFVLRLSLALALLLVQGAALMHVIGHTAEVSAARSGRSAGFEPDEGARHLAYCVDCLSFSGLDLPLADRGPACGADGESLAPARFRSADTPARDGLAPRCRAPPAALLRA